MRFFALIVCLLWPTISSADASLRQFHSQAAAPSDAIITHLERTLPDTVFMTAEGGEAILSYRGLSTPPALLSFLTATYPDLPQTALRPGVPVVIGVSITADSQITAMISAPFPPTGPTLNLPTNAQLLMDTSLPGNCAAQQIISQPDDIETTANTYKTLLIDSGFTLEPSSPEEVSYFFGRSDSCAAILYIQADPDDADATLVVLRLLEE
ncbi:MAG: hypothetical protein AAFQ64_15005 [Pseudomonadota bacterium]